jgi:tetratricopeptide (TPR) repeat protein
MSSLNARPAAAGHRAAAPLVSGGKAAQNCRDLGEDMTDRRRLIGPAALLLLLGGAPTPDAARLSAEALALLDPRSVARALCADPAARPPSMIGAAYAAPSPLRATMPLIDGLGRQEFAATSSSDAARRYFAQGVALTYGFRFDEAVRSFRQARAADPGCVMCAWGLAYALGPYVNNSSADRAAVREARAITTSALRRDAAPIERALVEALHRRYAPGGRQGGVHADAFADAMAGVAARFPDSDFVAILAAEAMMNTQPWDYWADGGRTAKGRAPAAIALVEKVLARTPDHPQATHLYVHLLEASTQPGRAEAAADRLRRLAPASPHLVHMPSHIYYRVGRYRDSVDTNLDAIALDEDYAAQTGGDPLGFYYRHHAHFVMSAAGQMIDRATALRMADGLEKSLPVSFARGNGFAQIRLGAVSQTRAMMLAPADFVALPLPAAELPFARAFHHLLRAEAYGRMGRATETLAEIAAARRLRDAPATATLDPRGWSMSEVLGIGEQMALGRLALARGDTAAAIRRFRSAIGIEAGVAYLEPPLLPQPANLALGAALLRQGDAEAARAAFMRALIERPSSRWALTGLAAAQAAAGDEVGRRATLVALADGAEPAWRAAIDEL